MNDIRTIFFPIKKNQLTLKGVHVKQKMLFISLSMNSDSNKCKNHKLYYLFKYIMVEKKVNK